jgi:hypothetical protein
MLLGRGLHSSLPYASIFVLAVFALRQGAKILRLPPSQRSVLLVSLILLILPRVIHEGFIIDRHYQGPGMYFYWGYPKAESKEMERGVRCRGRRIIAMSINARSK